MDLFGRKRREEREEALIARIKTEVKAREREELPNYVNHWMAEAELDTRMNREMSPEAGLAWRRAAENGYRTRLVETEVLGLPPDEDSRKYLRYFYNDTPGDWDLIVHVILKRQVIPYLGAWLYWVRGPGDHGSHSSRRSDHLRFMLAGSDGRYERSGSSLSERSPMGAWFYGFFFRVFEGVLPPEADLEALVQDWVVRAPWNWNLPIDDQAL